MKKWWNNFYQENKVIVWAAAIAIVLVVGILLKVPDEVTRFTLIMPVFAGFILFAILTTTEEELEDDNNSGKKKISTKKSPQK